LITLRRNAYRSSHRGVGAGILTKKLALEMSISEGTWYLPVEKSYSRVTMDYMGVDSLAFVSLRFVVLVYL
jgi:hypothetical protein